ncbi:P-loop containing nucleoside triphosphate hydrolase protein [Aspergillus filifer]
MAPSIIATCKQTRFHLLDDQPAREIDVEGLTISVTSPLDRTEEASKTKAKGKSRANAEARELISDAHLRLKAGVHYGLIGRNGTGKSTILQQTDAESRDGRGTFDDESPKPDERKSKSVLDYVMSSDHHRNDVTMKMNFLSKCFETEDPLLPVRGIRKIRHDDMQKQLFLAQKNASLKSGARGLQARKDLKSAESNLQISRDLLGQEKDDIDAEAMKQDTQTAMETLQDLQSQFEAMKLVDIEQQARQILTGLGFNEDTLSKTFSALSGGWRMRCMLASVLIQSPDIMILDEPTNFLDLLGVVWLEEYLKQLRDSSQTTIILVSHDRDFVNAVCEEIVIIRDQKLTYFKGNLSAYEQDFEEQKLYWGRMKEAQERQIAHMEATVREGIKMGKKTNDDNKLRMAKSRQKKLDDRMGIQVSARGGRFKLNRDLVGYHLTARNEIEVPQDEKGAMIALPEPSELRFPGPLISLEGITFTYKSCADPVLKGIDLVMHLGDRVGVMGLNGCGKSTLIRLVAGMAVPTQGKVTSHSRLKMGYYAQHSIEELQTLGQGDLSLTALGLMTKVVDGALNEGQVRGLLSSLGLQGRVVSDAPLLRLSGGQLVRLALARVIWNAPHLLVLDEITTHLDFHTVTALASALSTFSGAILLVSHDRFMVRAVIEGKRDLDHKLDEEFEGVEEEPNESLPRRRDVYVMRAGVLKAQDHGVEQFEQSLVKKVQKMLPAQG